MYQLCFIQIYHFLTNFSDLCKKLIERYKSYLQLPKQYYKVW